MAMVDLRGLYTVRAKGRVYRYAWRGGPAIKADFGDSAAFAREFAQHHADRKGGDKSKVSGLCAMFRASDAWNGRGPKPIGEKTKASWTTWLDRIQAEFGELRVEAFDQARMRPIIIKWRNRYAMTPRAADMGVQVLSRLLSFGMEEGKLLNNICKGVTRIYDADRSDLIWTEDDLARLAEHASPEVMQAARLAALTGLRQGDLLKLRWWHVKANAIEMPTGKSKGRRSADVMLYGELSDFLGQLPRRATTVLVNTDGEPWKTGFGSSWGRAVKAAGLTLHFHDLRGTAATKLFLGGQSIREIAQTMAWSEDQVEALINRYVKRDELLKDRIRRMDEHASRTGGAKPDAKPAP